MVPPALAVPRGVCASEAAAVPFLSGRAGGAGLEGLVQVGAGAEAAVRPGQDSTWEGFASSGDGAVTVQCLYLAVPSPAGAPLSARLLPPQPCVSPLDVPGVGTR